MLLKKKNSLMIRVMVFLVKTYQFIFGSFTKGHCRFYPSCSQYCIDAFHYYGFFKGLYKTIIRIVKCNPFHPGGYDPALKTKED